MAESTEAVPAAAAPIYPELGSAETSGVRKADVPLYENLATGYEAIRGREAGLEEKQEAAATVYHDTLGNKTTTAEDAKVRNAYEEHRRLVGERAEAHHDGYLEMAALERPYFFPQWGSPAAYASLAVGMLSVIGPLSMRMGAEGMLKSLNGALTGFMEGNKERYTRDTNEYNHQIDMIGKKYQALISKIDDEIYGQKLNLQEANDSLRRIASEHDIKLAQARFTWESIGKERERLVRQMNTLYGLAIRLHRAEPSQGKGKRTRPGGPGTTAPGSAPAGGGGYDPFAARGIK